MDAQTTMAAELYNTLNAENKEKVKNLIATLLSQQLDDQQSPDLQA
nr:MAG TPA_asm: hypothetical protein [Caudoviricetes sp.]